MAFSTAAALAIHASLLPFFVPSEVPTVADQAPIVVAITQRSDESAREERVTTPLDAPPETDRSDTAGPPPVANVQSDEIPSPQTVPLVEDAAPTETTVPEVATTDVPVDAPGASSQPDRIDASTRGAGGVLNAPTGDPGGDVTLDPRRIVEPVYPADARAARQEGTVVVAVEIGSRGRVASARVVDSSGYGLLDEAALRAIRLWRFARNYDGRTSTHRFSFRLESE